MTSSISSTNEIRMPVCDDISTRGLHLPEHSTPIFRIVNKAYTIRLRFHDTLFGGTDDKFFLLTKIMAFEK
jgi:hypothetical protein